MPKSLFCRGLRPRHPCIRLLAALTDPAIQVPCEREPAARCKNDGNTFLWTMPAAKERGDRGRWNYPSQATAAFEMVLSPGAGIASAAGKSALRARAGGLSFPSGEGGQGGKLKAGQGGDKAGTLPAGYSGGKPSRRPAGHAPRRVKRRQGQPPTSRAHPPPGTAAAKPSRRPKQSSPPAREAAFNRDSGLITFSASGQQHRRTARPARRRRTAPAPSRNRTICSPPQSFPQLHR